MGMGGGGLGKNFFELMFLANIMNKYTLGAFSDYNG